MERKLPVIAVGAFVFAFNLSASSGNDTYGPYACEPCDLVNPMPDQATKAFLNEMDNPSGIINFGGLQLAPGDKVVVCNSAYCVDYRYTNSSDFLGENERENKAPGSAGGGGDGPPSSGGAPGGGSGGGSGGGTVIVGPIDTEVQ